MSERQHAGFGQFIPGFDFLQNLAAGASASMPSMPNLSSWIAPTLDLEELDKRIGELKAVQFWLEQNRAALGATIQALEVQKMTLATLKGMDFKMADLAQAMKVKPGAAADAGGSKPERPKSASGKEQDQGASKVVDPMQWWTALTQQFQQIAATAMQDVAASAQAASWAPGPADAKSTAKPKKAGAKRPARKSAAG